MERQVPANDGAPVTAPSNVRQARPILEYARISRAAALERIVARIRPEHLTFVVAGGAFLSCVWIEKTPLWVAGGATGVLTLLWYLYARERSRRSKHAFWLSTDQLLLALVLSAEGIFRTLYRARSISQPWYWLPYNQTYMVNPAWALEPLRHTAVGIGWFTLVWVLLQFCRRITRDAACSANVQAE